MAEVKLIKWQEALGHLDLWANKVAVTKQSILEKYGDINELYNRSLDLAFLEYKGSLTDEFKPEARRVDLLLWELINEIEELGGQFISSEMGFDFRSSYHASFLDFWKYSVYPMLMPCFGKPLELIDEDERDIWQDSKFIKRRGREEVVYSVSWVKGKVTSG